MEGNSWLAMFLGVVIVAAGVIGVFALFGLAVMFLWNVAFPTLRHMDIWGGMALFLLCQLLLGIPWIIRKED